VRRLAFDYGSDRALLVWMTRLWPGLLGAAQVVQPEPGITETMNFTGEPAPRAAKSSLMNPPFPPAAETWARTVVLSMSPEDAVDEGFVPVHHGAM
jgi:hypothetical protein